MLTRLQRTGLYETFTGASYGYAGGRGKLTPRFEQFVFWRRETDTGDPPAYSELTDEEIADALNLAGAWSDLDWKEMAEKLDRIRHASRPTPPVEP